MVVLFIEGSFWMWHFSVLDNILRHLRRNGKSETKVDSCRLEMYI